MKCINCRKHFTVTIHRGKVGKALCPYCLTINQNLKAAISNAAKSIGYKLIDFKLIYNEKKSNRENK